MNSTEIKALDKERIVSTYARQDMAAATGKGSYCYDVDGKKYVDFTAGIGVNCLGYCDEGWMKAITDQLAKVQHVSNLYYTDNYLYQHL